MPLAHAWRLVVDVDHLVMTSEATSHYLASCTKLIERQLEVGGPTTAHDNCVQFEKSHLSNVTGNGNSKNNKDFEKLYIHEC